jgi:hypothetical protein
MCFFLLDLSLYFFLVPCPPGAFLDAGKRDTEENPTQEEPGSKPDDKIDLKLLAELLADMNTMLDNLQGRLN